MDGPWLLLDLLWTSQCALEWRGPHYSTSNLDEAVRCTEAEARRPDDGERWMAVPEEAVRRMLADRTARVRLAKIAKMRARGVDYLTPRELASVLPGPPPRPPGRRRTGGAYRTRSGRWAAQPTVRGVRVYLGVFDTEAEAVAAAMAYKADRRQG